MKYLLCLYCLLSTNLFSDNLYEIDPTDILYYEDEFVKEKLVRKDELNNKDVDLNKKEKKEIVQMIEFEVENKKVVNKTQNFKFIPIQ
ncbi:hypothetical protein [Zooshikella sp. RANM57]|uniref:hypothetical protein n=1 Tax=Zooshikella sp. RANM57 TaxID=3425863 RepID=UPI003D6DB0D9